MTIPGILVRIKTNNELRTISFVSILALLIALSGLLQTLIVGECIIGLYGVAAVTFKIPSTVTFRMALIMLVFVPIVNTVRTESDLPDTFAVYTFLLLVLATVSTTLELYRESRQQKRNKR